MTPVGDGDELAEALRAAEAEVKAAHAAVAEAYASEVGVRLDSLKAEVTRLTQALREAARRNDDDEAVTDELAERIASARDRLGLSR